MRGCGLDSGLSSRERTSGTPRSTLVEGSGSPICPWWQAEGVQVLLEGWALLPQAAPGWRALGSQAPSGSGKALGSLAQLEGKGGAISGPLPGQDSGEP